MPFDGPPYLTDSQIALLDQWVAGGAPRNCAATPTDCGDATPPAFAGLTSVTALDETTVEVCWAAAADDTTAPESIRYDLYQAGAPGGEAFAEPPQTTVTGQTCAVVRAGPGTNLCFVVRARDLAGNRDANAVEACATTPATACAVDFDTLIAPILEARCKHCHSGAKAPRFFDVSTYAGVLAGGSLRDEVASCDWAQSRLNLKTAGANCGERMPRDGPPWLSVAERSLLRRWIESGARRSCQSPAPCGDATAPAFSGATSAVALDGITVRLCWNAATDDTTAAGAIVYEIYEAASPGGEAFGRPASYAVADATCLDIPVPTGAQSCSHVCGLRSPLIDESLLVDPRGGLANVVVVVEGAAPPAAAAPPVTIEQKNCTFVPHVTTAGLGAELTITNDDRILHNVHAFREGQTAFNLAMPVRGQKIRRPLDQPGVLRLQCDSGHTWMSAFIVVVPHPHHAVTRTDGSFALEGLPPGTHRVTFWHETLGKREVGVTVEAGGRAEVSVEYGEVSAAAGAPDERARLEGRIAELESGLRETLTTTQQQVERLTKATLRSERSRARAAAEALFGQHCATCHGTAGDGRGPSSGFLDFMPRDFTGGEFEFRLTPSGIPATEDDIFRTITVGVLGTPMPPWKGRLTEEERRLLARYVMTFSDRFWEPDVEAAAPLEFPPQPPADAASVTRGRELFKLMQCAQCHGDRGRGDGPAAATTKDDWGNPIRPYDLTLGYFQGGRGPRVVYRAFSTGLSGSPMPSYGDVLPPEQRWDLVHYVLSLARPRPAAERALTDPAGRMTVP
jgi:cytochrome c oxidase cbb3-type subunit 2